MAIVIAHCEMLDRLKAEEEMAAAACAGVGRWGKGGEWIRRQWAQWRRAARGHQAAVKATPGDLADLGIAPRMGGNG